MAVAVEAEEANSAGEVVEEDHSEVEVDEREVDLSEVEVDVKEGVVAAVASVSDVCTP